MLTIRLFRVGRKNQPAYKIVVCDKRNAASRGRFVEEVGFYNPLTKQRNLKGDRVKYWISVGAKPSGTVHNMLVADSVIEGKKLPKHKTPKKPAAEQQATGQTAEKPAAEAAPTPETPDQPADTAPAETEAPPAQEEPPKQETPQSEPESAPEAKKEASEALSEPGTEKPEEQK